MKGLEPLRVSAIALLDAERRRPSEDPAAADRILERLNATLGGGGGGTPGEGGSDPAPSSGTAAAKAGSTLGAKTTALVLGAFLAGGGAGAGLHAALVSSPRPVAIAATSAVAVTAWPAVPTETERSSAMRVRRLAGRNSAVTRPNTPRDREMIAAQAASSCRAVSPNRPGSPCRSTGSAVRCAASAAMEQVTSDMESLRDRVKL
jgi:hypothetical protein